MKNWLVTIAVIVIMLLAVRIIFKTENEIEREMQSFVHNLNYNFTAKVDSVIILKKGGGYLICKITSGKWNESIEDSLNQHLTNFKRIRFLHFKSKDKFLIVSGQVKKLRPMDSIVINSSQDKFHIFRDGQNILKTKVSLSTRHKVSFAFWIKD
jgi:hypothetical protein